MCIRCGLSHAIIIADTLARIGGSFHTVRNVFIAAGFCCCQTKCTTGLVTDGSTNSSTTVRWSWKFLAPTISSFGNLQLSAGRLQLPARPTLLTPRRRCFRWYSKATSTYMVNPRWSELSQTDLNWSSKPKPTCYQCNTGHMQLSYSLIGPRHADAQGIICLWEFLQWIGAVTPQRERERNNLDPTLASWTRVRPTFNSRSTLVRCIAIY